MELEETNIYEPNIRDRYENHPDNLNDMCLADFATTYIYKKVDVDFEPDDEKSYIKPVLEINKEEYVKTAITTKLKNGWGKTRKRTRPIVIRFHTISKLKGPEEYYWILPQRVSPELWREIDGS